MSRRRYLTTLISVDKRVRQLSDSAALLYTWMIPHAEEDATIDADPDELAAMVTPNRPTWTTAKIIKCCSEIEALDLFIEHQGRFYFPPVPFYRIQSNIHMSKRRTWHPEKNPCVDTKTAENSGEQRRTAENSASPSPSPSPSKHMLTGVSAFDSFWKSYPRKVGKIKAEKAFKQALKESTFDGIMEGLMAQLPTMKATEERFRPHPTTWLNEGRWSDETNVPAQFDRPRSTVEPAPPAETIASAEEAAEILRRARRSFAKAGVR